MDKLNKTLAYIFLVSFFMIPIGIIIQVWVDNEKDQIGNKIAFSSFTIMIFCVFLKYLIKS